MMEGYGGVKPDQTEGGKSSAKRRYLETTRDMSLYQACFHEGEDPFSGRTRSVSVMGIDVIGNKTAANDTRLKKR